MANKSRTKRKSETTKQKKVISVTEVLDKAKDLLEFEKDTFIVSELSKSSYKIGKFIVQEVDGRWQVDRNKHFFSRVNAAAYCALVHVGYEKNANSLFDLDKKIQTLINEQQRFKDRLVAAVKQKDDWKTDLYIARYQNTTAYLQKYEAELQKTLTLAKYIKLWPDQ